MGLSASLPYLLLPHHYFLLGLRSFILRFENPGRILKILLPLKIMVELSCLTNFTVIRKILSRPYI